MAVPGYSITDLLQALRKCKDIRDAFQHPHRNAAARLTAFNEELERVENALKFENQIYEWTGRHYTGIKAFYDLVNECTAYLQGKQALLDCHKGKDSIEGLWQTVLSAFDDEITSLRARLSHCRHEFLDFKVNMLLENALCRVEQPVAATRQVTSRPIASELSREQAQKLRVLQAESTKLIRIINEYKRRVNNDAVREIQLQDDETKRDSGIRETAADDEISRLGIQFENTLSMICRLNDFPDDYQRPQVSLDQLRKQLTTARVQTSIESSTRTARYSHESEGVMPRECEVRIKVEGHDVLTAASYLILGDRRCIFRDTQRRSIFEHRLLQHCHPDSCYNIKKKPLTVYFLEPQEVSIMSASERSLRTKPEYGFMDQEAYMQFQSDLRLRTLKHEARVSSIWSKQSRGGADADDVYVKCWQESESPHSPWLSFQAMFQSRVRMWEVPLKWFSEDTPSSAGTSKDRLAELTLLFAGPPTPVPGNIAGRTSKSRFSFSQRSRTASNSSLQSDSTSSAASIRSFDAADLQAPFAPENWIRRVGYLKFCFENKDEMSEFVHAYSDARKAISRRPSVASTWTPSIAYSSRTASISSAITTPSDALPLSPTWSAAGQHNIPRRPVGSGTSTARTSPMPAFNGARRSSASSHKQSLSEAPRPDVADHLDLGPSDRNSTATGLVALASVIKEDDEDDEEESLYSSSIAPGARASSANPDGSVQSPDDRVSTSTDSRRTSTPMQWLRRKGSSKP